MGCKKNNPKDWNCKPITDQNRVTLITGAAWGVLTALNDNSVCLFYQKARLVDSIEGVNVSIEMICSTDDGKSWSNPIVVEERLSPKNKYYDKTLDGGFIVYQSRNLAVGQLKSGRIICAFDLQDYYYNKKGESIIVDSIFHSTFINQGVVYCYSDNNGKSWSKIHNMDLGPISKQSSPHFGIVTTTDGSALMSIYGSFNPLYNGSSIIPNGTESLAGIIRSKDNGETWSDISIILTKSSLPYQETSLLVTRNNIQAFVRTDKNNIEQYKSSNNGYSWDTPIDVTEIQQLPAGPILLKSGKILLVYGNRKEPFGVGARLSFDNGLTFDTTQKLFLGKASGSNCGYANGVQLASGKILITYYDMPTTKSYKENWNKSSVYLVKFSEDDLMATYNENINFSK